MDTDLINDLLEKNAREISTLQTYQNVPLFYKPIRYVLDLGGKRIRPLFVLLSCGVVGADPYKALPASAAVELLHNFTLVHDDIMDKDETRRGMPAVHVQWDTSTAILAGDGLLGFAFQKLLQNDAADKLALVEKFTRAMIVICEGQGLDKMFEESNDVTVSAYLDMIERKTAALLQLSCELGAMIGEGSPDQIGALADFGYALGMAFQLQDDVLDIMADERELGKKVGSDFERHKQTILTIKLRNHLGADAFEKLTIQAYKDALYQENIIHEVTSMVDDYFERAEEQLDGFNPSAALSALNKLSAQLRKRRW